MLPVILYALVIPLSYGFFQQSNFIVSEVLKNSNSKNSTDILKSFERTVDRILEEEKERLLSTHFRSKRTKRSSTFPDSITRDATGVWLVEDFEQTLSISADYPTEDIIVFSSNILGDTKYYGVVALKNGVAGIRIYVLEEDFHLLLEIPVPATSIKHFQIHDKHYLLVYAHDGQQNHEGDDDAILYRFDDETSRSTGSAPSVVYVQTIKASNPSAVSTWLDEFGNVYMAVTNTSPSPTKTVPLLSDCYRWEGSHFDKFASIITHNSQAIESFNIYNHMFLAVANHNDANGKFETASFVYKLDVSTNKFLKYQDLITNAAKDVKHFSFVKDRMSDHFLVFANMFKMEKDGYKNYNVPSVIYKLSKSYFVPFQCIQTNGALQWLPIKGKNQDKFLLALLSSFDGVRIYQYDGWRFRLVSVPAYTKHSLFASNVNSLSYFLRNDDINLVLSPNSPVNTPNVFTIRMKHFNFLEDFYSSLENWCLAANDKLKNLDLKSLQEKYNSLPRVTDTVLNLEGPLIIEGNLKVDGKLKAKSAKITNSNVRFLGEDIKGKIESLTIRLSSLRQSVQDLKLKLSNSLKKNSSNELNGELNVRNLTIKCSGRCDIGQVKTTYLNGHHFDRLVAETVNKDSPALGQVPVTNLVVEGDLIVEELMNNKPMADYVTINGDHVITAPKSFSGEVSFGGPVNVETTIDGVLFHKNNLMLKYGDQIVKGRYILSDGKVGSIEAGHINGVNISNFYDEAILIRGSYHLQDIKTFASPHGSPLTVEGDLSIDSNLINNLNLVDLDANALRQFSEQPQFITGSYMYDNLNIDGDVTLNMLNQLRIPEDVYLVNSNVTYRVDNKVIIQDASIIRLNVTNRLNDVKVEDGKLNLWTVNDDVVLSGKKVFKKVDLNNDPELAFTSAELNTLDALTENEITIYGDVWFNAPVTVNGQFNGMNLNQIFSNAIPLSEDLPYDTPVQFRGGLKVGSLVTKNLNGIDPDGLLRTTGDQVVTGPVEFYGPVTFQRSVSVGFVNGVKLSELQADIMTVDTAQVIPGNRTFTDGLRVTNLTASEIDVNGFSLDDAIYLDTDSHIDTLVVHGDVVLDKGFDTHTLMIDGAANGVNVKTLYEDSLFKDKHEQEIVGHKDIDHMTLGTLSVNGDVNGFDFKSLADNFLNKRYELDSSEDLIFEGPVTINNLEFRGHLDGISADTFENGWLTVDSDQIISGDTVFLQPIIVDDIEIPSNIVSGIDLNELFHHTAKIDENATFYGDIFFSHLESTVPVEINGKVSGLDLSSQVVKTSNPTVKGNHILNGLWSLDGNIWIDGYLNGRKVEDLCNLQNMPVSSRVTIEGDVVFHGPVTVHDKVNGKKFPEILDGLWLRNKDITIHHPVKFDKMRIESLNTGVLNGMNIDQIFSNYVSITGPQLQVLNGMYTFEEPLTVMGRISASNILTPLVNGVDINKFAKHTLLNVNGDEINSIEDIDTLIIQGSLTTKTINGLNLTRDFALHGQPNVIRAPKVFEGDVVFGNLDLPQGVKIQGIDISEWAKTALLTKGDFNISSKKFTDLRVRGRLLVEGLVNGVKFDRENILLKNGDQTIMGPITIQPACEDQAHCAVEFENIDVLHMEGDLNLLDVLNNAILKDEVNLISGTKNFSTPPMIETAHVKGLIGGVDLVELYNVINTPVDTSKLSNMLSLMDRSMKSIAPALKNKAVAFDYFILHQDFPHQVSSDVQELLLLNKSFKPISTLVYSSRDQLPIFYRFDISSHTYTSYTSQLDEKLTKITLVTFESKQLLFGILPATVPQSLDRNIPLPFIEPEYVKIYQYYPDRELFELMQYLRVEGSIADIEAFVIEKNLYVFLSMRSRSQGSASSSLMFIFDHENSKFMLQQKIEAGSAIKSSFLKVKDNELLFITNFNNYKLKGHGINLSIMNFHNELEMFDTFQTIPCPNCIDVSTIRYQNQYYVITTRAKVSDYYFGGVEVFKYCQDLNHFARIQTIDVQGPLSSLLSVLPSSELYLYIITDNRPNVRLYLYKGASGFVLEHTFDNPGAQSLAAINTGKQGFGLAFSGQATRDLAHAEFFEAANPNKLYIAKFVGM